MQAHLLFALVPFSYTSPCVPFLSFPSPHELVFFGLLVLFSLFLFSISNDVTITGKCEKMQSIVKRIRTLFVGGPGLLDFRMLSVF